MHEYRGAHPQVIPGRIHEYCGTHPQVISGHIHKYCGTHPPIHKTIGMVSVILALTGCFQVEANKLTPSHAARPVPGGKKKG